MSHIPQKRAAGSARRTQTPAARSAPSTMPRFVVQFRSTVMVRLHLLPHLSTLQERASDRAWLALYLVASHVSPPVCSPSACWSVTSACHFAGGRSGDETNTGETAAGAGVQALRLPGILGMRGLVQHVVRRDLLQPTGCSLQAGCSRSMLHTMVLGLTLPCPFPGCLQVGPKAGEGSFAVVHRGREVSGRGRDVAIKVVRSQGELGLRDADPKGGCAYIDVLNSILSEIDILEVRGACGARQAYMRVCKHVQPYPAVPSIT